MVAQVEPHPRLPSRQPGLLGVALCWRLSALRSKTTAQSRVAVEAAAVVDIALEAQVATWVKTVPLPEMVAAGVAAVVLMRPTTQQGALLARRHSQVVVPLLPRKRGALELRRRLVEVALARLLAAAFAVALTVQAALVEAVVRGERLGRLVQLLPVLAALVVRRERPCLEIQT